MSKKITDLTIDKPDKNSTFLFAGSDGIAKGASYNELNKRNFTDSSSAYVAKPLQSIGKVHIDGDLTGIAKDVSVRVSIRYSDEYGTYFEKEADIELQGGTSLSYPKKNYNIDLLNSDGSSFDIKFGDWPKLDSYTLKANYTDNTHTRNILISRIIDQAYKTKPMSSRYPWSKPFNVADPAVDTDVSPNRLSGARAAVDGFPVEVELNGVFLGLYTWNLPKNKDNYMLAKDDPTNIMASPEDDDYNTGFAAFDYIDPYYHPLNWTVKYPKTENQDTTDSMVRLLTFLSTTTSEDFKLQAAEYFNIDSLIDYCIFLWLFRLSDNSRKNMLWTSYDGLVFSIYLYDMDISLGCNYDWWDYVDPSDRATLNDPLWVKYKHIQFMYEQFLPEIKQRYAVLREKVLHPDNIEKMLNEFANQIPVSIYKKDAVAWPSSADPVVLPGNPQGYHPRRIWNESVIRIADWYRARVALIDEQMDYNGNQSFLVSN